MKESITAIGRGTSNDAKDTTYIDTYPFQKKKKTHNNMRRERKTHFIKVH